MEEFDKQIVLLENFLARMDFQEKQSSWILKGSITRGEYMTLTDALRIVRAFAKGDIILKPKKG